ncbi:MAG: hypothetical protein IKV41_06950 [Oscillospiraceae bacterium]|nr:hypothetical protein [Oscillospiraceae bacterium]
MKIVGLEFLNTDEWSIADLTGKYFKVIKMDNHKVGNLVRQYAAKKSANGENPNRAILDILQDFNPNIVNVNLNTYCYTVNTSDGSEVVNLSELSSGERLCVMAEIVSYLEHETWFQGEISSLTYKRRNAFITKYANNQFVNLVVVNSELKDVLVSRI